ncbi:unnamed protein product [Eretmochelys imbricata]
MGPGGARPWAFSSRPPASFSASSLGSTAPTAGGAKGSPFAHQRLQDGSLEDLALNLDSPKGSYDWFLYEMDDNKFPAPLQPAQAPPWPCPPPQPLVPAPQTPPGDKTPGPTGSEQPKPSPPRLECLSPANLPAGNFL